MNWVLVALLGCALSGPLRAEVPQPRIEAQNIREYTRFLSDDIMEGRAPGSRGGELAARYVAHQFILAGLEPANGESYFQDVAMVGIEVKDPITLSFGDRDGRAITPQYGAEFVAWPPDQETVNFSNLELVFVGYGIRAPEMNWDDYKGQNMNGKVLLMLVNDPPSEDPAFFGGRALTYYGRWTYKFEEAARQGAAGVLLIHTTEMAGYPWQVVESSWSGEQFKLQSHPAGSTLIEGWVQESVGEVLMQSRGLSFSQAVAMAAKPGFQPVPLGLSVSCVMQADRRLVTAPNVIARLPGSDPQLKDEHLLITSHYDHLGIGKEASGDVIYNGALDNASGTAGLIELSRVLAASPQKPRRSILFAAVTAEEQGLLGSAFYAAHPLVPLSKTAANINFDAINVWGPTSDMVTMGAEHSTLEQAVAMVAGEMNLVISPDPQPEKGSFFRSDQFSLVKVGVPAVFVRYGYRFQGKSQDWGEKLVNSYTEQHYHQPSDEFDPTWSFEGAQQMMEFVRRLVLLIADDEGLPRWKPGSPFANSSSTPD
jgi:Zn-dependent M28 family amino/carboxypeptidase